MTILGLSLISLAWLIQLVLISQGKQLVSPIFVGTYIVGVALLIADGFNSGLNDLALANLVSMILAVAVFFALKKRSAE
jgi:hypothetical protein